ncbi:MAG: hypothetical protein WAO61_01280 [Solirubrobacterales bacterium]
MSALVPSFVAKVARAKKHLVDLEHAVEAFASTDPYTVSERVEGKKKRKIRRLTFTAGPANTDIPLIAADAIHNLRSSLDHIMSAMVAPKDRGSCQFPIYFQGVSEPDVPGENEDRLNQRARWRSDTKTLPDDAVAALQLMQPRDLDWSDPEMPILKLLNSLWNTDKHTKLPVVASGMADHRIEFTDANGVVQRGSGELLTERHVLENEAEITGLPYNAVDVKITGTALVGILVGTEQAKRYVQLPRGLDDIATVIETEVFPVLTPYVRP